VQQALTAHPEIQALGVVTGNEEIAGIIVRRDFFATMARPYAQDVFRNHTIREVMAQPVTFSGDSSLFAFEGQDSLVNRFQQSRTKLSVELHCQTNNFFGQFIE